MTKDTVILPIWKLFGPVLSRVLRRLHCISNAKKLGMEAQVGLFEKFLASLCTTPGYGEGYLWNEEGLVT
jgi:hypothetical protein